jgi:hypothetical protein
MKWDKQENSMLFGPPPEQYDWDSEECEICGKKISYKGICKKCKEEND